VKLKNDKKSPVNSVKFNVASTTF